jgi:hypothetical protein
MKNLKFISVMPRSKSVWLAAGALMPLVFTSGCATPLTPNVLHDRSPQIRSYPNLTRDEALRRALNQQKAVLAKLEPVVDPYFGKREMGPTCNVANLPAVKTKLTSPNFSIELQLFASENFVFGLCDPKLDIHKSRLTWFYCETTHTLYDAREFRSASEEWFSNPGPSCETSVRP